MCRSSSSGSRLSSFVLYIRTYFSSSHVVLGKMLIIKASLNPSVMVTMTMQYRISFIVQVALFQPLGLSCTLTHRRLVDLTAQLDCHVRVVLTCTHNNTINMTCCCFKYSITRPSVCLHHSLTSSWLENKKAGKPRFFVLFDFLLMRQKL